MVPRAAAEEGEAGDDEEDDRPPLAVSDGPLGKDLVPVVGQERPTEKVGRDPEAAEEGEDEKHDADEDGVDAEAAGHAGGDAGGPLVLAVAADPEATQPREDGAEVRSWPLSGFRPWPTGGGGGLAHVVQRARAAVALP